MTTKIVLANGKQVDVTREEIGEFISQILIPNPYWLHAGLLNKEEVERFLTRKSNYSELQKVARYFLIFMENLSFTGYLFDKAAGQPNLTKEFNMPVVIKLRELYQKVKDVNQDVTETYHVAYEMENLCRETGADPL